MRVVHNLSRNLFITATGTQSMDTPSDTREDRDRRGFKRTKSIGKRKCEMTVQKMGKN
jgi:hypothetical protein